MSLLSRWRQRKTDPVPEPVQRSRCLSYQCAVVQGIGARDQQEDDWVLINAKDVTQIRNKGLLAAVADGMGGMSDGALASATGIRVLREDFRRMDHSLPLEGQLNTALFHASNEVYRLLQGSGGSTLIACILFQGELCYSGVGDSYLYLLRGETLIRINREQNVLHQRYLDRIRDGLVDVSAGHEVSQPHAVTGFLGANPLGAVDCLRRSMPLLDGDVLLLCSDGIGGVLQTEEIRRCLQLTDANESAAALKRAVLTKGCSHQDNFTGIVICCRK